MGLAYKVFTEKYGEEKFNSSECPVRVNPLLFSQLCLYHNAEISDDHDYRVQSICLFVSQFVIRQIRTLNLPPANWITWLKKVQTSFIRKDGSIGQVTVGTKQEPFCISSNSSITFLGVPINYHLGSHAWWSKWNTTIYCLEL